MRFKYLQISIFNWIKDSHKTIFVFQELKKKTFKKSPEQKRK